ncbi:hypothetical protein BC835DRAFT_1420321 [Cytidiella melzeri]|nr:hypothetical protein BC835DRAFT_1420321 [Cytidiella melzeri]
MAGKFDPFNGPTYISSRSADVILSDVRPIKLKLEALRSMNVLLDEFLYKLLSAANSLSTEKLKAGLNKVLPTTLGKDAVLEAELELKAYWERNTPHTPTTQEFDLQWSFELLRLKCEAYSTMNDTDEDAEVEKRLNERMMHAGGSAPPHASLMAPAALYLTAILEQICQHVLSNVSRVAARDSSRTLATVHDLFVALCEDPSIYPTFKTMKVYEQIESFSTSRRTKSPSKSSLRSIDKSSHSRTATPSMDTTTTKDTNFTRPRVSSESVGANAAAAILAQFGNNRASQDKSRIKLFGRSSSDQDRSETPRSFDEERGSFELMDEEAQREFDELMRSSTTMKVSLTPDRLKSMEVYKQERRRRAPGQEQENDPAMAAGGVSEIRRAVSVRRAHARLVDAITEDDEPSPIKAPPSSPALVPRTRQKSFTAALTSPPSDAPSTPRSRSVTISSPQSLAKKRSVGQVKPSVPYPPSAIATPQRQNPDPSMQNGRPQRTRKVGRRRESMDLDDIMGGADDDASFRSPPRTPGAKRDPSKTHISKTARDLIDFLDEGPPAELEPPNVNASMISLDSSRSKSGRLQRMISKLSLSSSSEKLNGRGTTTSEPRRSPVVTGTPPSAYLQSSVSSRNSRAVPAVIVATPPPPPGTFSSPTTSYSPSPTVFSSPSAAPSPPFSPNSSVSSAFPSEFTSSLRGSAPSESPTSENVRSPGRRISIARKAVPTLDAPQDRQESPSPVQTVTAPSADRSRHKPSSPLDEFPSVPAAANNHTASSRARGDTMSGKSDMSIGAIIWAESSSLSSPPETAPPSPTLSARRPSKQTPLTTPVTAPTTNGINGVYLRPRQPSTSPEPEPEVQNEESAVSSPTTEVSAPEVESAAAEEEAEAEEGEEEEGEKLVPAVASGGSPTLTFEDAQDLHRMLMTATSADECRLLVAMFLVKSGYPVLAHGQVLDEPVAAPEEQHLQPGEETDKTTEMERSLVMHYLGGFDDEDPEPSSVSAA